MQVPFGDVDAMDHALSSGDVAAVIMETIPATYGFPLPPPGYLEAVKELTIRYGALYIADEMFFCGTAAEVTIAWALVRTM